MIGTVAPVTGSPSAPNTSATSATSASFDAHPAVGAARPDAAAIHKVAKEFEKLMIHQLLEAAKVGGSEPSAYSGSIVDALTDGVSSGGGLGLAKQLENVLQRGR